MRFGKLLALTSRVEDIAIDAKSELVLGKCAVPSNKVDGRLPRIVQQLFHE